jgi:pyruvate carboxylase
MALMMVAQNLMPRDVLDPARDMAFPGSVVDMLRGDLGQPPGGWPKALQKKVLKDVKPFTVRPGSLLAEADLDALRAEGAKRAGRALDDNDLASYLMYPKVFGDFARAADKYGPVSVLPTPIYFYGMKPGEEAAIEIESGKTLVILLQAVGETDEDGRVKVFFELNGQPRVIVVPNRGAAGSHAVRRKADETDDKHVAAPMPGSISSVVVKQGDTVKAGDVLLTIEAMKMETALHAPRDGKVTELLVATGHQVEAKDLLAVIA